MDKSHGVEHGFDTCRVAIDKEELEELGELVVNGERIVVVAFQGEAHHAAELFGERVADDGDDS